MSIERDVLEKLRNLPGDKQREVLAYVEALARQADAEPHGTAASGTSDVWTGEAEMHWLREHGHEHEGRWVALDGDALVASGEDGAAVYAEARALGYQSPFVTYVEPKTPFVAGW